MPFEFRRLAIPDVILIVPGVFADERGAFMETFRRSAFAEFGIDLDPRQVNESFSRRGTLRGLHYQLAPRSQGKLIRVLAGEVFDVAVDLRREAPTFGRHVGVRLDAESRQMLWIPRGFAHGFCAQAENTHVLYMQDREYAPRHERGIHPLDPDLAIDWGVPGPELVLSDKDRGLPPFDAAEHSFRV